MIPLMAEHYHLTENVGTTGCRYLWPFDALYTDQKRWQPKQAAIPVEPAYSLIAQ